MCTIFRRGVSGLRSSSISFRVIKKAPGAAVVVKARFDSMRIIARDIEKLIRAEYVPRMAASVAPAVAHFRNHARYPSPGNTGILRLGAQASLPACLGSLQAGMPAL